MKDVPASRLTGSLLRGLAIVWNAAPRQVVSVAVLTMLAGVAPLASLYLLKLAIDQITSGQPALEAANRLGWLLAGCGGLFVAHVFARHSVTYASEALGLRVVERTQEMIAARAIAVPLAFYEDPAYFDTLHLAQREAAPRLARLVSALCQATQGAFSLAAVTVLLAVSLHWSVGLMAGALALPAMALRIRNARALDRWQRQRAGQERRVNYYEWLLSAAGPAKEGRIFGLGAFFAKKAAMLRRTLSRERLRFTRHRLAGDALGQGAAAVAATGVIAVLAFRALRGAASVGDVVLNFQAFLRGTAALQECVTGVSAIFESQLFIGRLAQLLDLPLAGRQSGSGPAFPLPLREGIEFRGVSFAYPGATRPILDRVSFRIEPGETVALVGENGAGKTTLVKLLCGLYEPTVGSITIDGIDLREFDRRTLWDALSVVFQDFGQYCETAEENIRYGDLAGQGGHPAILRAAREAGAHEFIDRLPTGYAQPLGALFEGGQELSQGQWQKVALARAFFRDAPIIVLDEPSSALDVRAENEVFQKFRMLARGRTAILISHRLSTVRMADRILLLEDGTVAETGSHDELVSEGGLYADLFETQAGAYR